MPVKNTNQSVKNKTQKGNKMPTITTPEKVHNSSAYETITLALSDGREIVLKKPLVRDMRAVGHIDNDFEREMHLVCNLTGLTLNELDELELKEYKKLQEGLQGFLS